MKRVFVATVLSVFLCGFSVRGEPSVMPAVIPFPAQMKVGERTFELTANTRIVYAEAVCAGTAHTLAEALAPATG